MAALQQDDGALPPTPPSQDSQNAHASNSPTHADAVVTSLLSKQSSLSTPVNIPRSPPTPDASPPRTNASNATLDRPLIIAYPSSRAESFRTAREDPLSSDPSDSRSMTPWDERLDADDHDRGLGLAFERDDNDITPTEMARPPANIPSANDLQEADTTAGAQEDKESLHHDDIPDREWDTNLMRNVTLRRKQKPRSISSPLSSPQKEFHPAVAVVETASPSPSPRPRPTSALRERVKASSNSPVTPSIENFAHSIGWPAHGNATPEGKEHTPSNKRHSTSSMGSTVVEAKIIVTPPRRRQTLRRSGKNMAYRRDDGSPTPDRTPRPRSNRTSLQSSEDVPLHRLVHKRVNVAEKSKRMSEESDTLGTERNFSTPTSFRSIRQRTIDSSAATLRHQESVRNVLGPAADMLSRSNTITRPYYSTQTPQKRNASAPEPVRKSALASSSRNASEMSPSSQHRTANVSFRNPIADQSSPPQSPLPSLESPQSLKRRQPPANFNKSLPDLPSDDASRVNSRADSKVVDDDQKPVPSTLMDRVRQLVAEREAADEAAELAEIEDSPAPPAPMSPPPPPTHASPTLDSSPPIVRGTRSLRRRSSERRRSSLSGDGPSWSPDTLAGPSPDQPSTEETNRRSFEWRRPSVEHGRVSFDRSTIRTEEHAMARHLFAQTTPFSQSSDTPFEVSEATAVSIYPHNNHSLLVVQQSSRVNSMAPEQRQIEHGVYLSTEDHREMRSTPTPPFMDASESHDYTENPIQPMLTFEPSTPPMQIALPQPNAVDSPLKNPRPPPEPPQILFIPPTPAEELEKQLVPGPPKRSDSHPQRRLSLVQKARRYSDNLLPTLLGRSTNGRGRYARDPHAHSNPRVPTVSDEDGTLHPFWRPRGFWDGFDDSDSESDSELPLGGDTSDIEEPEPPRPKRTATLGRKLTNGFRGSGGFLIGNSLGVERAGTNKRRHHITLPPHFPRSPKTTGHTLPPKVLIQPPTMPLGPHSGSGISKRTSRSSLRAGVYEIARPRASWREGRGIPGIKKYQVQYIGLSGVKQKFREGRQEKRREKIRRSIGTRYYVETGTSVGAAGTTNGEGEGEAQGLV